MGMKPQVEQELAHVLLTELLAYQFASPVRWIETQDVILGDMRAERVVEIGPSPTLAGMAQRTLKQQYQGFDAALSLEREVLSYSKDARQIYYDIDVEEEAPAATAASSDSSAPAASDAPPAPVAAAPAAAASGPVAQVEDIPLTALQVLLAIVTHKLKKPVEKHQAIKDLVGGKSTIQNEILGDLSKEFGTAPDKAEEIPLSELAESLPVPQKLGKHTASLVARLASQKMPGGFGQSGVRKYLESRWGLGSARQDAVMLIALTREPPSRLGAESDAKAFLDGCVQTYASSVGLDLSAASAAAAGGASGGSGGVVDAAALEAATKDQKQLARQQLELLAQYLKIDLRDGAKKHAAAEQATALLQKELDLWLAEHGDTYAQGIAPIFSPLKSRTYDSSWNWARQECFRMFYDIIWGHLSNVDREIVQRCITIMNRSNPVLIDAMLYYIDHVPTERGVTFELARDLASELMANCQEALNVDPVYKDVLWPTCPKTTVTAKGNLEFAEEPRAECRKLEQYVLDMAAGNEELTHDNSNGFSELESLYADMPRDADVDAALNLLKERISAAKQANAPLARGMKPDIVPYLHLRSHRGDNWAYDPKLTAKYIDGLERGARDGITFTNKTVLLTGAGSGSIGAKVLEGLLMGGAKVIVTTSRFSKAATDVYQHLYTQYGSRGSKLVVVPFNQASVTDCRALVDYIYETLKWDLDFIVPFAALPEGGIEMDGIESRSELAHRLMLTNLLRLLGFVKKNKQAHAIETRPAQVVLPLSPNHGTFGGDGLYSESKLSLETLFNRWHSESWGGYITVCGAVIGWTRGTGLMAQNNVVAEGMETELRVRTFSQQEMAFNILGLMTPGMARLAQKSPVWADLNGGMDRVPDLKSYMANLRHRLQETAELRRAVAAETSVDQRTVHGDAADAPYVRESVRPRANLKFEFPTLREYEELPNHGLKDMVNLDSVAVITGFSEVGPWGNSRTRWEMEAFGTFSLEGAIEMAWIMGLIRYDAKKGGWVDAKSGTFVDERDVKSRYEEHILEHAGIRLIEPEMLAGYDPKKKQLLQEVLIEHDLEPFEASRETAEQFVREHGVDKVEIMPAGEDDLYNVRFLKGARIMLPKALQHNRLVAGQIPTGWDARVYGVPDDIVSQVDPVTLYTLVSTAEALICSGVTDPYEFYKYVHVSELGNATGSGMGGMSALRRMFKDRYLDHEVQNDVLQESFINTMSAWVNMLLLSSSGPVKTPVGACATAIESVDTGIELIRSGAARIVLVGGADDLREEGITEFANMNATSNSVNEFEHGRAPSEMSRPTTTTRAGFMEAHGAGVQVLMSASLALQMGVPIHGIVALTATATDKIGRSIPAPGKGIMTVAREVSRKDYRPLDLSYRRRQLEYRRRQIKEWAEDELREPAADAEQISRDARRQEKEAQATWSNDFWRSDQHISPLRGALATWGLTIDDIGVASFHGTSTQANDKNESESIDHMLRHLGRSKGNPVVGVFQKYLTGHPKGAAGAWQMNGMMQILGTGIIPGNRNADNVDPALQKFDLVQYSSVTLKTYGVKAGTITSFGFGQKGGFALLVHPDYLFSTLTREAYESYKTKVSDRYDRVYRYLHDAICNNTLVRAKDNAPYTDEQEQQVYLDPSVRVSAKTLHFPAKLQQSAHKVEKKLETMSKDLAAGGEGVGVDVELVAAVNSKNDTFVERNFTEAERAYCEAAADPRASFAGTWSAKEAVFKALNVESRGGGAPLKEIEIVRDSTGPHVVLHGNAAAAAKGRTVRVSISHDEHQAAAVAVAK